MAVSTEAKRTHRGWVTAALLLALFMTAIEITIVATAMPRIVAELGGFALLSWVFSAYLLTQVVSIPLYGKLADLYGRKPILILGVFIFLVASILCGQAKTMVQLILFRFLQGVGGGAVQPISVTLIGDLYPPEERHKIQAWTGSVFAFSSLVGPALGAFIVDFGHWAWIFYLNVPLGVLSLIIFSLFLHEEKRAHNHKIDFGGAVLLVISTTFLMIALLEGGTAWPWLGWQSLTCLAIFAAFGTALIAVEARVSEPVLPLWIFKHPLISIAGAATFLIGAMMTGYAAMIPTHVQGVLNRSPLVAGLSLASMSIGWPLASFYSGKVMKQIGYRKTAILGGGCTLLGVIGVLIFLNSSAFWIGAAVFVMGIGLGLQSTAFIITIQSTVPWRERGVATANNMFMRTLGSSVGVAAFGGILNSTISKRLGESSLNLSGGHGLDLVNQLLSPEYTGISVTQREIIIEALGRGMTAVFQAAIPMALVCLVLTFFLPSEVKARS